jgi:hypothetical protein
MADEPRTSRYVTRRPAALTLLPEWLTLPDEEVALRLVPPRLPMTIVKKKTRGSESRYMSMGLPTYTTKSKYWYSFVTSTPEMKEMICCITGRVMAVGPIHLTYHMSTTYCISTIDS